MAETVKVTYDGKTYEFPVLEGTCGEKVVDLSNLRGTTGLITFDAEFMSTGSCQSQITL
jgi:citrate synthase